MIFSDSQKTFDILYHFTLLSKLKDSGFEDDVDLRRFKSFSTVSDYLVDAQSLRPLLQTITDGVQQ